MLLWLVFALLSAGVLAVLLRPLLGPPRRQASVAEVTADVYRHQLAEIEAELQRGQIGPDEAEVARREIARRLLSSASAKPAPAAGVADVAADIAPVAPAPLPRRLALTLAAVLPVLAVGIYVLNGSPWLPAQPVAQRRAPPVASPEVARLIAAVEARLKQHPEDGRGWDVIAPVYLRLARYQQAADAYARAALILGDSPDRLAGLAEASMLANDGRILPEARSALERLLKLQPDNARARFWLAFAREQQGDLAAALAEYEQLLKVAPTDAGWHETLAERHETVRMALAGSGAGQSKADAAPGVPGPPQTSAPAPSPPRGPTEADVAAAERLSAGDRQAMIDAMVSGLAARLEKDGRDLPGWQRLIRALIVLGRRDEALAALARARKSFEGQPQQLTELADFARSLGLGS